MKATKEYILRGGTIVDAAAGTTLLADVHIKDGKIAKIGQIDCKEAEVIDCTDKIITAGYINAHVHIESSMALPSIYGSAVLPWGTTSVIADPHEIANVGGAEALRLFLQLASQAPINIYTVIPSSVPATPYDTNGAGKLLAEHLTEFVGRPDVVGLGEVMCCNNVVARDPEIMDKIALFKDYVIDGHMAGLPEELFDAYISAGIHNDHECIDSEGLMQRYNRGLNIYVREGDAARNSRELLSYAFQHNLDANRFAFATDDKHLATIAFEGEVAYQVAMARDLGWSWPDVAKMASYNTSRFYKLPNIGNVQEGFIADLVVTNDMGLGVYYVFKNGILVAQNGQLEEGMINDVRTNYEFTNTVSFKQLTADDFIMPEEAKQWALSLVKEQLITQLETLAENEWKSLPMLATIERYGKNGNLAMCPFKGYNIKNGAVATSVSHDSHNVVCAGDNPEDMALAANRLREIGGGYVVASCGNILCEMALPAFGLMSHEDAATIAANISAAESAAYSLDVSFEINPFTTLSFVALPVIPFVRLVDTGLYDVINNKFLYKVNMD